jgi:hypothetical protein
MFNLDQSIADWRRHMAASGIKSPELLDELESHLREDVEQRVKSGLREQEAFATAARQIGRADVLKNEFNKARETNERSNMKRVLLIGAGASACWWAWRLSCRRSLNTGTKAR